MRYIDRDIFEGEKLISDNPPSLKEINNRNSNEATIPWLFEPFTGEHWKGKKYKVD